MRIFSAIGVAHFPNLTIDGLATILNNQYARFKSFEDSIHIDMFCEYIHAALSKATYEIIDDEEPFYGEITELRGVWAIGKNLEECRENLKGVVEGWIALRLRLGLAIPPVGGHTIETPSRVEAVV